MFVKKTNLLRRLQAKFTGVQCAVVQHLEVVRKQQPFIAEVVQDESGGERQDVSQWVNKWFFVYQTVKPALIIPSSGNAS